MGRTFNQIKNSVLGKDFDVNNYSRTKKKGRSFEEIRNDVMSGKSDFSLVKTELEKRIGIDTFESDLSSMSKTLVDVGTNWQTQETMNNTRASVEAMQGRLNAYKEYNQLFGGGKNSKGITEMSKFYGNILSNWDAQSELYNNYKTADAFNKAKTNAILSEKFKGLSYDAVQAEKKKYKPDSDEYKFLDTYLGYTDLNDYNKAIANLPTYDLVYDGDSYKASLPDELIKYQDKLKDAKNVWELDHKFDLYKHYMDKNDFEGKSKYVSTEASGRERYNYKNKFGYTDYVYEYINADQHDKSFRNYIDTELELAGESDVTTPGEKGYNKLNPEEVAVYNYIYATEGKKKAQAFLDDMEKNLQKRNYDEKTKKWESWTDTWYGATAHSVLSVPAKFLGAIPTLMDTADDFFHGRGYNPYSPDKMLTNYSQDVRQYVSEDIAESTEGWELFGTNVPSFLYNTTMSIADSAVGVNAAGSLHMPIMATDAFHQKAKELVEAGEDSSIVYAGASASAAAEWFFERVSFDRLMKMKNVDSARQIVKATLKQGGIEASEEFFTEVSNIVSDTLIRGDSSDVAKQYQALLDRGFTKEEAEKEVKKKLNSQIFWAGAGGFLSGNVMGPMGATRVYNENKSIGKDIKVNARVPDVFDIASNPEVASAYEAYTKYAKKGINADNISDAKVGNLYSLAKLDATETLDSKHSTTEERKSAQEILDKLSVYTQANISSRTGSAQNIDSKFYENFDAESVVELIEGGLESSEGTESHRLATELKSKIKNYDEIARIVDKKNNLKDNETLTEDEIKVLSQEGILSSNDIQTLIDANEKAIKSEEFKDVSEQLIKEGADKKIADIIARKMRGEILTTYEAEILAEDENALAFIAKSKNIDNVTEELLDTAKNVDKGKRGLFISAYDGKSDIDAYTNAFNLAVAKAENNFSANDILKHSSVLSTDQVKQIYSEVRTKVDQNQRIEFKKISEKTANQKAYKGKIDDSVIDYNNTSTKGKVNWNELTDRQRKAVTFMIGFAKATGLNLTLTTDGDAKGINGAFVVDENTIILDIFAGVDIDKNKLLDTIIPTASHELTHWMEKKSPVLFNKIKDLVFSTLEKADGIDESHRIANEIAKMVAKEYKKNWEKENPGKTITLTKAFESVPKDVLNKAYTDSKRIEVARSEIIARACEDMLSRSKVGMEIFNSLSKSEQKTLCEKIKDIIENLKNWVAKALGVYKAESYEASILREYQAELDKLSALWDEMLTESVEVNQALEKSNAYGHITSIGSHDLNELSKAVNTEGKSLFQYKAMEEDKDVYREMLLKHQEAIGITNKQINDLFDTIDKAVDIISDNLEALDYAWDADINERAFSPIKPNSDSLYQVSLDFSTLCRKRLLQQTIQNTLQEALNKNLSKEESIAIRDELIKVQEEGRKIEVACALCYVESVRMKSPAQINKFLNNREGVIREFFANRSGGSIKEKIQAAEMRARETIKKNNPDGYLGKNDVELDPLTAPKSRMRKADADFVRAEGKKARASYKLTEHEQAELDVALKLSIGDFTSAKGLENLAKNHRDLFDAYTSFVRNATHSKGIENDTWWRAGDSESIGDNLIAQMNKENGLRSQSWSDFQVIHLLDYIAATIELSTKGAKRQSYTKVPDYVKLLGNTGDMINLSLIPERVFNGKLAYDGVEGMAYDIAKQLRDEYHATVGTICIGINNEQIRMLLEDGTIDMVIPYHHSSMSAATRKLMHIPEWETYQNYQGEKNLSDAEAIARAKEYGVELKKDNNYQKAPKFSEWFNLEEARQIAKLENANPSDAKAYKKYGKMYGGYKAMQNAANNYLKLCAERGIAPKFSHEKSDFTHDANYWKLLTDRKMVDNVTGEIIEQKAIKPIFNEQHVLEILNDELARYPQVKADQEYAQRKVVEKFLSGEMKVDKSTLEAIQKPVDNISKVNILESSKELKEENTLFSMKEDIEETRDLIALHNMSAEQLVDVVSRNQFTMPSVAVTNKGFSDFGDISIVFNKETIDPTVSDSKLFGSDAWTPQQTRLKKNPKFDNKEVHNVLKDIKRTIGNGFSQIFDLSNSEFVQIISEADGSVFNALSKDIGMQTAYALKNKLIAKLPKTENGRIDTKALQEQLDANLDKDAVWRQYKRWLGNISDQVITSYDNATNEDILSNMQSQPDSAKRFRISEDGELTVPAKEYNTIDDFRANKQRLSEDAESMAKEVGQEFVGWAKGLQTDATLSKVVGAINSAFANRYDSNDIARTFSENGIAISKSEAKALQTLYKKAVELPTPYFEAKPQGAVGLEQIAMAVLPNNISNDVKSLLTENNIPYTEYESGNTQARLDTLNSLEEVRFSERDSEYLELAKDIEKNEERLNEMVYEKAKESGFPTKVYHGTTRFGFTKADVKKSDDGISVFATESLALAQTYSGTLGETRIKESSRLTDDNRQRYDNAVTSLVDGINAMAGKELLEANSLPFEEYIYKLQKGKMNNEKVSSVVDDFAQKIIDEFEKNNLYNKETDKQIWDLLSEVETSIYGMSGNAGNYGLYANTDNFLEVDGNGANWNTIPFDKIQGKTTANTREIVKWAKDNGYSGVTFKNIVDDGYHQRTGTPANVYAFFNPQEQLKSADPVTYNAFGRVIPLSKRFNTKNDDIRYSDKFSDESISIKKQLKKSQDKLNTMDVIATINTDKEFKNSKEAYDWAIAQLKQSGYKIERIGFGEVVLDDKRISNSLRYLKTQAEYAAYAMIPKVIKRGVVVDGHPNHKARGYDTITFGAPVEINGKRGNMAVVIRMEGKNYYKLHRILMPDGSVFEYKKRSNTERAAATSDVVDMPTDITSKSKIPQETKNVKELHSEKDQNVYDTMGETERIRKENEKLNADVGKLSEIMGSEEIPNKKFLALANYLKKISGNNADSAILATKLKEVYASMQKSDSLNWNEVARKTHSIAESIMSRDLNVPVQYFQGVMHEIRKDKISLSAEQRAKAEELFGGYGNFHKYVFGRANVVKDGTPLSDAWKTWADNYPQLFDANLNETEQIEALVELVTTLSATSNILNEYEYSESVRHLSTEIYNQFWNIAANSSPNDVSVAYRNEHKSLMETLRKDYEKRQSDLAVHPVGETALKYESLLKKVQEKKRKEVAQAKEHGREMLSKYKENAERKTHIQRITANALTLNKWLTKNNKDYHIHEAMKGPVIKLLNALDFSSKRMMEEGLPTQRDISLAEAFSDVKSMLESAENMVPGLESLYGHDLSESIELLSEGAFRLIGNNEYVINSMSNEELFHLDKLVRHVKKVVTDLNKFHTIQHENGAVHLANEFMEHGEKLGKLKKQHGTIAKHLEFRNRTPYYFFKDLGSAGMKLFNAFQDGWDKLAFNAKKIIDYTEKTYTDKEVNQWSKETKTFKLTQFDGKERTIEMSVAQIMALHCVSKQADAQNHLLSGGMTLKRLDNKGRVIVDYENISLSLSDMQTILSSLTDRQKEVADKLQEFMNKECSDWGNEISMARFGIKQFGIPDYFPIKVSEATVPTDNTKDIDNASLFRLLNMSFTKSRNLYADQSIEIGDIFDIFAQHASDMAKYNALALPVLDFNKFYSIHGRDDATNKEYGVVNTLKSVFGDEANGYIRRFVRDINGSQNVSRDVLGNTFFKNAKVASVAANLRVVLLQPTAFFKASAVLDAKYLAKASAYIKVEPFGMVKKLKKAISDAEKHCGIVQWKALGYYDTDISKGLTEKIKHSDTIKDKIVEKSMKGAELADKVTFGTLWVACEFEIRDTRKDLKVGSEEFYNAIANRLREVIYATQVVDSTMTRSDMMRSSDRWDKVLTTFGSEPTIAYNMLLDMATQYKRDKQEFGKEEAKKRNGKKIRKVVIAYVITNAVAALVESGFDIFRDDDDEEKDLEAFIKLYFKNFAYDMSIGNKLPYVKELYSLMQGYSSSRMDTQWASSLFKTYNDIKKHFDGKGNWEKTIKDLAKATSDFTGIPIYNIYRDGKALLDNLDLFED